MLAVLRRRNYGLLWFAQLISMIGDWAMFAALPYFVCPELEEYKKMNKFSIQKYKMFVSFLALICASLACNLPDIEMAAIKPENRIADSMVDQVFHDDCEDVDRIEYERSVANLGREPETPKYPEGAIYKTCYEDDGLYDAFMIDGDGRKPDDNELTEVEQIPAGRYTGESNFYSTLENDSYLEPVCTENTVTVVIENDGEAWGDITSICYSKQDTDNEEMQMTHHSEVFGLIQGEWLDNAWQLSIYYTWHSYITSPQWETPSIDETVDFVFPYHINVFENVMTLTPAADVEEFYSFELFKQ